MDIRKLRYFMRVVELGSISRASGDLHIAQPALSKSILTLEQELQAKLLHRSAQGIMPTEAGVRLYDHGEIIFRQLRRAQAAVKEAAHVPAGQVVIGMPYSVSAVLSVPLLQRIGERFPRIQLRVVQEHSHILSDQILSSRVDIGVIARPRPIAGLNFIRLVEEALYFVSRREHRSKRDGGRAVSLAHVAESKLILPSRTIGLRVFIDSLFEAELHRITVAHEVDAISVLVACVEAGLGSTIIPGSCVGQNVGGGRLVARKIQGEKCYRNIALCHSAIRPLDLACERVVSTIHELVQELVQDRAWRGATLL